MLSAHYMCRSWRESWLIFFADVLPAAQHLRHDQCDHPRGVRRVIGGVAEARHDQEHSRPHHDLGLQGKGASEKHSRVSAVEKVP